MTTVSSYITPKARKGDPSPIQGKGLYAREPITRGEVVAIKGGHIVDARSVERLDARLQNSEIQIAPGFHLVALSEDEYDAVMLYLNHSCEPNVGIAGNSVFVAMRAVVPGEELTTDYALFDDHPGSMTCACGSGSCRGVIAGQDWRRPELQQRYGRYFSRYLRDRMAGT